MPLAAAGYRKEWDIFYLSTLLQQYLNEIFKSSNNLLLLSQLSNMLSEFKKISSFI